MKQGSPSHRQIAQVSYTGKLQMFYSCCKKIIKMIAKHAPGYQFRAGLLAMAGYSIGNRVFIGEDLIIKDEPSDRGMVKIGDRVAIADRVMLVTSSRANFSRYSSQMGEIKGPIEIGEDAWLGAGCIVLPGVRIGRGAVVGAASLVTTSVPEFTVVAGVPARPVRNIKTVSGNSAPQGASDALQ